MLNIKLIVVFILTFLFLSKCTYAQIETEKDSLESLLPFAKDNQRVDIYIGLADVLKQTDTSAALNYTKLALKISNSLSYTKGLAGANIILGYIDRSRADYKNAKTKYLFAISYAIKSGDLNTIAWAYQNMGNLYYIQSDYTKAMRYYMGALSKGEQVGNLKRIALASNQIGSLFLDIGDTLRAAFYYHKSYKLLADLGDEIAFARISNNLGNIYRNNKNDTKALYYYSNSLDVFKRNNLTSDISSVLNNIGMVFLNKNQYKKALSFIYESYLIDIKLKDFMNASTSTLNLSSIYLKINKIDSALYFANASLNIAKEHHFALSYTESCRQLSIIFEQKGDNEKALFYANESNEKQVLNANKGAQIEAVHADFERAKNKETLKKISAENKENKTNIIEKEITSQRKNVVLIGLIFVIVFLILISILFFYFLTQSKKRKNLEETSAIKSNILHRINHELRTPLNSLINYSYLANESKNLTELREFLSGINASGNDLIYSMNNIVSYIQIDSNKDEVVNAPFNFIETLQSIFIAFQIQCNQKNILFSQLISPDLPMYVIGDKIKIITIIQNLLSNALKFSDKGVIKIELKLIDSKQNQNITTGEIAITVIDEGRGLKGKKMKDLVLPNDSNNQVIDGFGIGLFIVKKYIEKLNGNFNLTNNQTVGCCATVNFNLQIDETKVNNNIGVNNENWNKKLNILLVEDDLTNSYTLQKILERKGHSITCVYKGKDAFTILLNNAIDIVLLDIGLPDMNGIELAKYIRLGGEFAANKDVPIIALSANADPLEMQDCMAAGINEYITKPIGKDLLLSKINELVCIKMEPVIY